MSGGATKSANPGVWGAFKKLSSLLQTFFSNSVACHRSADGHFHVEIRISIAPTTTETLLHTCSNGRAVAAAVAARTSNGALTTFSLHSKEV